ncbi:alpha/beta hydrolase [Actinoplanes sp. ATCC 53533]|uniref:alpha/beta hydrolase n=1 Tax=Actinoplanes sp. ATCC 53533 TaxID=1288362 RepID=UPI000F79BA33|nr:alpha/beta hydrolase [Actinoplanes sp. ATCC 53533]RSM73055.1 alpha/beta hydrolase [Actinoplanes sp. ATCC 53533]
MTNRKQWRSRVALATAVTLATTGILAGSPARAAAPSAAPQVAWSACEDGFECATVPAPLDYDRPRGVQIAIALIRLPATDPARRIGSLLFNPGGPGGSGVEFARAVAHDLAPEVRARFDIVGFDPRGINLSTPLRCFDTFEQAVAVLPPFPYPDSPAEERQQRVSDDALAAACARHGGAIRDHMSSADAARDMDLLRDRLGDEKLSYVGYSYGSLLGQNYANLFPSRVRALVIDGVVDPVAWSTGHGRDARTVPVGGRIRSADGARRTLGEFFRLCDAAGAGCAFSGDASRRYAALAKRLRGHPATITDPFTGETSTFTYNDLIAVTLGALYDAHVWPDLAFFLDDVQRQLSPAVLGQRLATMRAKLGLAAQEEYPNAVEGSPGVACSDTDNPGSFAAWQRSADRAEQRYGYFGRIWNWAWSVCRSWPASAGQDRHLGPWTARTSAPVLVVGNYFDPATGYHGAQAAARLLPSSRLLTYAGWGHVAYFIAGNACVDTNVNQYLLNGRVPAAGTVCQPQGSPFGPATAAAQRTTALSTVAVPAAVRRSFEP